MDREVKVEQLRKAVRNADAAGRGDKDNLIMRTQSATTKAFSLDKQLVLREHQLWVSLDTIVILDMHMCCAGHERAKICGRDISAQGAHERDIKRYTVA